MMYNQDFQTEYEILSLTKLRLYQRLHGLAPILGAAEFCVENYKEQKDPERGLFFTDGQRFCFDAARLREDFLADSSFLCLEVLHLLSHCLLGHPFRARYAGDDKKAWNLQTDLEAWELTERLWGASLPRLCEARAALEAGESQQAARLLYVDDHGGWIRADERQAARWQGPGEKLLKSGAPKARRKAGQAKKSRERRLVPAAGQRGDYRELLKGLSAYREETRVNPDEFQYSWYVYGLELYENLPLIEPLEYSEERKIADLVIVLDTSGSCEKELVRVFLEETRGILEQERLFFRRFCLHILQCDNQVQRDDCIRSREEFTAYLERLTIRGGGGTDFRPAFARIEELRRAGELGDLRGILYFTDGCGRYPKEEPDYQVWFVMLQGHFDAIDMPGWVRRLVLEEKK